ncbi:DEHA2D03102p [Debaryomyces hansenii CBS767]|uniref:DEHA2D03102p n=1 Tax=Debaryomyces hansenii (strain ATCC 36239 / CBS 767 / BCRC 21394 / JCM 1990 / NBRC 0083 / IGC 2968) TaxID=284592 RepID=Q6BT68_DEBHA|nr:DEHA2D03102p [Debaryomyces hansenii CBS767]CAG86737.1 DEHA2D03102p [Debaryomyces hansenii CBS767]|eukprot:XP_458602.1 DEHA2D03102p [Debaryomyces hansenii CBS767]
MSLQQSLAIHLYTNSINPMYISPLHQFLRISAPTQIQSQISQLHRLMNMRH